MGREWEMNRRLSESRIGGKKWENEGMLEMGVRKEEEYGSRRIWEIGRGMKKQGSEGDEKKKRKEPKIKGTREMGIEREIYRRIKG